MNKIVLYLILLLGGVSPSQAQMTDVLRQVLNAYWSNPEKDCEYIRLDEENSFLRECPSDQAEFSNCYVHAIANVYNYQICESGKMISPSFVAYLFESNTRENAKTLNNQAGDSITAGIIANQESFCDLDYYKLGENFYEAERFLEKERENLLSGEIKLFNTKVRKKFFYQIIKLNFITGFDKKLITFSVSDSKEKFIKVSREEVLKILGENETFNPSKIEIYNENLSKILGLHLNEVLNKNLVNKLKNDLSERSSILLDEEDILFYFKNGKLNYENYLSKNCKRFQRKLSKMGYNRRGISHELFKSKFYYEFSKRKKPMAIGLCASSLMSAPKAEYLVPSVLSDELLRKYKGLNTRLSELVWICEDETDHVVTVVGRRWNKDKNRCEFLLRNSWGASCEGIYSDYECDEGSIWLPKKILNKTLSDYFYLK
ncbi:MAG: hypothetical protein H6621_10300 [Halobacteriovoraceae bacterium]|nr:hypothetical protein [Halobacteriovoraceae bacterium]MCB9095446.1 hypothetical protein [Halobacteriovoraceae bacterium]